VWTLADIKARGEKVYASNCAVCHQATARGAGPIKPHSMVLPLFLMLTTTNRFRFWLTVQRRRDAFMLESIE
jgi:hypothetical protein